VSSKRHEGTRGSIPVRSTQFGVVAGLDPAIHLLVKRDYERYTEFARAEALAGNPVGAEHAEHYFRTMNAGLEGT
jgi:hypothetical protein